MASTTLKPNCQPKTEVIKTDCTVGQVLSALRHETGRFALESSCDTGGYGRYSLVGANPIDDLQHYQHVVNPEDHDGFAALEAAVTAVPHIESGGLPFAGGWVGFIPYECGEAAVGIALSHSSAMRFALYDSVAIYDHKLRQWTVLAVDFPQSRSASDERLRAWRDRLAQAADIPIASDLDEDRVGAAPIQSNMSNDEYFEKVARAIEYIRAGDIYQVNLTQRFTVATEVDPLSLYLQLQRVNPADYSAYLGYEDQAILSASPELFVHLGADGSMITRPIKGTRPRIGDDDRMRDELRKSEKDRAELTMIVDLLRNDMGRVCQYGSIDVTDAAQIETHPTVHHLVGTIVGQANPGVTGIDVLRAMFPGGSITGCPKTRAMEIIRELEPTPREAYCGAIGYLSADGSMNMNIAIRTMIHRHDRVHVYAGGAITADSSHEDEYNESLSKAKGMFRALGIDDLDLTIKPIDPTRNQ
ncbi:MAG: aminodeoxychorismate synthase, component I [Phycisphaerae bacterium]|nr:MAG: aminodeoxychorismate synthase, component I [Phycisphaerae bacterium]